MCWSYWSYWSCWLCWWCFFSKEFVHFICFSVCKFFFFCFFEILSDVNFSSEGKTTVFLFFIIHSRQSLPAHHITKRRVVIWKIISNILTWKTFNESKKKTFQIFFVALFFSKFSLFNRSKSTIRFCVFRHLFSR